MLSIFSYICWTFISLLSIQKFLFSSLSIFKSDFFVIQLQEFLLIYFEYWSFIRYTVYEYFLLFCRSPFFFICCAEDCFVSYHSICIYLLLLSQLLVSNPRNHCQDECRKAFLQCLFFLEFHGFIT